MSPNMSYSERPSAIQGRCFRSLWSLLLAISLLVSPGLAANITCCPEETKWLGSSNCSDGSSINLQCEYGIYIIDPELNAHDNFTIIHEDGEEWLLTNMDHIKIASNRFCVTKSVRNNGVNALVCFEEPTEVDDDWKDTVVNILSIISAVFLIATLAVYVMLPELRELQDKAMMASVTTLAVSYIVLSIQHFQPMVMDLTICIALGFILYYVFLSVFFWLNIVAFNVWRAVWFKNFRVKEQLLFYVYCVWGWGGPTCLLIIVLTMHHMDGHYLRPGFGENSCWFAGVMQTWVYFYAPVGILLASNIVYLSLTSWRLWHQYRDYNGSKLRVLRFKCLLYIKLVIVMGITWIFELVSFAVDTRAWLPTDLLNALQGFIIFLLLVATRKRVRKLLAKKRPCGIGFPKSWAAYEDEECEDVLPEELELSQQG